MKRIKSIFNSKAIVTIVWIIALVTIWEIAAFNIEATKRTPENILPHIYEIIGAMFSSKIVSNKMTAIGIVINSAKITLIRAFIGFAIGIIAGAILAFFMKISKIVEKTIFPYLMLIQIIPILGMAPIVLAITHNINTSRIVIAAILTFYPVATNTLAGFNSVEKEKYQLMYSYAASKFTIYKKVLIPACIPYFFTGLKIAAPMAITASILVDTLQGDGGLGCMLSQSLKHAMSIYVFWLIVVFSAFIGIMSSYLMGAIEKLISPQKSIQSKKKGGVKACIQEKKACIEN